MAVNSVLMVQVADKYWNYEALHYACMLARRGSSKIALVRMVPVQHIGWLGTELGNLNLTDNECAELEDCATTVEDYGVEYSVHLFQYRTLADALLEAADVLNAEVVFATLPPIRLSWWDEHRMNHLRWQLARQQRVLFDSSSLFEPV